ncbi:MAG TPA: 50S ribosomal protein L21 [Candidatus Dormibacteraeota bacterium]|jgi:large subunit ribosomal protein L21|nr:50S ribosomal protein L21 [Candidatus Dormibacteraeota bacterium]
MYAILSHGGRQFRVSAGDRLLVDRLAAEVGSVVALEPLLLTGGEGETTTHGKDLEGMRVAATVVAHRRGKKLRIFKYKAKKRSRTMAGYRSDLTELRVDSILAKGAALPKASAGNGAAAPAARQPAVEKTDKGETKRPAGRSRTATATAGADAEERTATTPKAKPAPAKPKATAAKATPAAASKPATKAATKAASKAASKPASKPRAAKKKESGDGA